MIIVVLMVLVIWYEAGDKIAFENAAINMEPSMVDDAEIKQLSLNLIESYKALFSHLNSKYLWD